jgi:hypothetical protein
MEYGGKCTKLFFNLQHRNAPKNNLLKLVTNDGVTNDSRNYILEEEAKYFKACVFICLLQRLLTEANCMDIFSINNFKWTAIQKDLCEGEIIEKELLDAIKAFNWDNSRAGWHIPFQVYQTFFDILRGPLLACFNHSYVNGRLSDTQQGLISLLLKQDTSGKYKDPVL